MGPKKDIPSCLLQRLGQRDKLYQTSKHMHWICYSGARKVMCSAGVTVCKKYLIQTCPTESEFAVPPTGALLILLYILSIMKRFAEGTESMKKIPRHKIGRCLSCMKKVHFINCFRDSGILRKTLILTNYATTHSTVNFLNTEMNSVHLAILPTIPSAYSRH